MKSRNFLIPILFFFVSSSLLYAQAPKQETTVLEVLSLSRIKLVSGKELRLADVASSEPSTIHSEYWQWHEPSLAQIKQWLEKKVIWIEWPVKLRDRANTLQGYVFLSDGTFVNQHLIENGYAKSSIDVANQKYRETLLKAESKARRGKKGLWSLKMEEKNRQQTLVGDVNAKIYYYPDSSELADIPEANRTYFASRVEAKRAGFKRCHACSDKEDMI